MRTCWQTVAAMTDQRAALCVSPIRRPLAARPRTGRLGGIQHTTAAGAHVPQDCAVLTASLTLCGRARRTKQSDEQDLGTTLASVPIHRRDARKGTTYRSSKGGSFDGGLAFSGGVAAGAVGFCSTR